MKHIFPILFLYFISTESFAQHSMIVMPDVSKVPTLEEMNNPHPEMNQSAPIKKEKIRKEITDLNNIKIHSKLYDEVSKEYQCVDFGPNISLEDVCKKWEPKNK